MHPIRSIRRLALGAALTGAAVGAVPAVASAATDCIYDPVTRTATVTKDDSGANKLLVKVSGGLIVVDPDRLCVSSGFDFASVNNTDRLEINQIVTNSRDGVTIDESGGEFAPGFTTEADRHSEIEIVVRKAGGIASAGETTIIGTPGNDVVRIARGSVSLQRDLQAGADLDEDTDIVLPPAVLTVFGGDGSDFLSGQGYGGRLPTLSNITLSGGTGDDTIFGGSSGDDLFGEAGNDTLRSVDQATDNVIGGSGFDNAIHDKRDGVFTVESAVLSSVGRLVLTPRVLKAEAGQTARMTMRWKHPKAWRELRKVDLSVYRGKKAVGMINARPADGRLTDMGAVHLMSGSKLGHHGKWVTAKLAIRLRRSLAGEELRVDVRATDSDGQRQLERGAGTIRVGS